MMLLRFVFSGRGSHVDRLIIVLHASPLGDVAHWPAGVVAVQNPLGGGGEFRTVWLVVVVGSCVVVVGVGAAVVVGSGRVVVTAVVGSVDGGVVLRPATVKVADNWRSWPLENLTAAVIVCDPFVKVEMSSGRAVPSAFMPAKSNGATRSTGRAAAVPGSRMNMTWSMLSRPRLTKM